MTDSTPAPVLNLKDDFKAYYEISRNIGRVALIPHQTRLKILDRANKELSANRKDVLNLIDELIGDDFVYEIAGINYAGNPHEIEELFTTALADYLLRNK